uniref:Uncharacterized protein n=1 Tax=Meloidogyne incognita TaxID=6306 RepID=A0A914LW40_MELIC
MLHFNWCQLLSSLLFIGLFCNILSDETTTRNFIKGSNKTLEPKYECRITKALYEMYMGVTWHGKPTSPKKYCREPGCFYIQEQSNFGWVFPGFLNEPDKAKRVLMGCRSDIPYLLLSTNQNLKINYHLRLHQTLIFLRACFAGIKDENSLLNENCQAESDITNYGNGEILSNETWLGRFLPSAQKRCFYKFIDGIFFVRDEKLEQQRIVCCSNGTNTVQGEIHFRETCKVTTRGMNDVKSWRITDN